MLVIDYLFVGMGRYFYGTKRATIFLMTIYGHHAVGFLHRQRFHHGSISHAGVDTMPRYASVSTSGCRAWARWRDAGC